MKSKLPRRAFLHLAAGAAILPAASRIVFALDYPTRPVRIIVGFSAGSTTDIIARLAGQWLQDRLGQPFVIENRPGAALNYQDKEYTAKDLDTAVASTQREILQIADYLHAVNANLNMLRYYQSVLKPNEVKYLSNEEALDLGIAILIEETGQLVEAIPVRRN